MAKAATTTHPRPPHETATHGPTNAARPKRAFGRSLSDFPDLNAAEKALLACVARGEVCVLGDGEVPETSDPSSTIRAGLIRFLALGGDDENPVHEYGVRISGGWIDGAFDLDSLCTPTPLSLVKSNISEPITIRDAALIFLEMSGSKIGSFKADHTTVSGSVFLDEGFSATGEVRMLGVTIGGNLQCSGGTFLCVDRSSLNADRAKIAGNVFLDEGFSAAGTVRMLGVKIGGDLACGGSATSGRISSFDGLNVQSGSVAGVLFLEELNCLRGVVDFSNSEIGALNDISEAWPKNRYVIDHLRYARLVGSHTHVADRINWLSNQREDHRNGIGFKPQPWEHLIRILRDTGHGRDADEVAIAKQEALRAAGRIGTRSLKKTFWWNWEGARLLPARRLLDLGWNSIANGITRSGHVLYGVLAGYGYSPTRIVLWMAVIMAASGHYFSTARDAGLMAPTRAEVFVHRGIHEDVGGVKSDMADCGIQREVPPSNYWYQCPTMPSEYTTFNPWWYSIDLALPLVDLQQDSDWAPAATWTDDEGQTHNLPGGIIARCVMWFEILAGWFLSLMFVAIIGRLVEKD
jgi:hypothetical protein